MRIGIVLHGPEIVDVGSAKKIIEIFRKEHEVIAKLGGTMGRTAVLDAGLEDVIDISRGLTPSETVIALKDSIDLAILLNHGKTLETGMHFGRIIASRLEASVPFVHIERPDGDGRIIYYRPGSGKCAAYVRKILETHYDLPVEKGRPLQPHVRIESDKVIRKLAGAFAGENIRLDGIVIGRVTGHEPEIVCKDGRIVELRGGEIKPHGLEKLNTRRIDLFRAKVKTGNIRRTAHESRIKRVNSRAEGKVAIIDHRAESTFELIGEADIVITVGDDTTAIAADILTRLGIPIIGITDGDLDCILQDTEVPQGSAVIRVREGYDDIVGREVFEKLMGGKQQTEMQNDLLSRILFLAEGYVMGVKYY